MLASCLFRSLPSFRALSSALTHLLVQSDELSNDVTGNVVVIDDFVSTAEAESLFTEVHTELKKHRYELDHWDDAIHNYREVEKSRWNDVNQDVIDRIRATAFDSTARHLPHVHVLDLHENGYIKPHVDSVRYCGPVISGVSLLSDCVMRLIKKDKPELQVDVLVKQRSLYILRGVSRYEYTHEVLSPEASFFRGDPVKRGRRISIICRSQPDSKDIP